MTTRTPPPGPASRPAPRPTPPPTPRPTGGKTDRRRRRKAADIALQTDKIEFVSLVCEQFCEGRRPSEIRAILQEDLGVDLNREEIYRSLAYAAERRWIQFVAPIEHDLSERLREQHPWLARAHVAHTAALGDVAAHTATVLLDLVRTRARAPYDQEAVHIGFAGGHAMRSVARNFARLLQGATDGMPARIVFHALVSGFEVRDPTTNPNAFFTYFVDDPSIAVQTEFVGLHAPPVVSSSRFEQFKKLDVIEEAFQVADQIDIIVTSGGSWSEPCDHSMLRSYMRRSPESLEMLEKQGCCGDLMWRPIAPRGPITARTPQRAMTLVELSDLEAFTAAGKSVLFMLGPCRACHRPRTELLKTILGFETHLVSHVVTDSRTAAGVFG